MTEIHDINRDVIVHPIFGALALLQAHKHNDGLNVATARRTLEWCWSTYSYLYGELGEHSEEVTLLIKRLESEIKAFDYDAATNTEDGWSFAMKHYNTCDYVR